MFKVNNKDTRTTLNADWGKKKKILFPKIFSSGPGSSRSGLNI